MAAPLSRTEAVAIAQTYATTLRARVYQFLRDRARQGHVGGLFPYGTQDSVPVLLAVRTELQNAGWTVVVDTDAKTAEIS